MPNNNLYTPEMRQVDTSLKPCVCTPAKFVKNHDGDTLTFDVTRLVTVRLAGINTPEMSTEHGKYFRDFVANIMGKATEIKLVIPTHSEELLDISTFNRVVAHVIVDGQNLSELVAEEMAKMNITT